MKCSYAASVNWHTVVVLAISQEVNMYQFSRFVTLCLCENRMDISEKNINMVKVKTEK